MTFASATTVAFLLLLLTSHSAAARSPLLPEKYFHRIIRARLQPRRILNAVPQSAGSSLFAIPRGGGLGDRFFRRFRNSVGGEDGDGDGTPSPTKYPALTRDEIEERLGIPVFGITDPDGNGVAVHHRADGNSLGGCVYLFLSKSMADAALQAMRAANDGVELKVTALHLGKVWFRLLHGVGDSPVKMKRIGSEEYEEVSKPVQFRLVPGARDLVGARLLCGLNPTDVELLKSAVENDAEQAREMIRRAVVDSPSFRMPYNEIPVFLMSQLRVRQHPDGEPVGEYKLPLFLSAKKLFETYLEFIKRTPELKDAEPSLQLVELHKIVEMMQSESDVDFRNVVLFPASTDDEATSKDDDEESDDDDDDDNGGDGSLLREQEAPVIDYYGEVECTPYVSMEVFEAPVGSAAVGHGY